MKESRLSYCLDDRQNNFNGSYQTERIRNKVQMTRDAVVVPSLFRYTARSHLPDSTTEFGRIKYLYS